MVGGRRKSCRRVALQSDESNLDRRQHPLVPDSATRHNAGGVAEVWPRAAGSISLRLIFRLALVNSVRGIFVNAVDGQ